MNGVDLSLYIARYEVIDKRLTSLDKLKSGFNIANSIQVRISLVFFINFLVQNFN